MAKTLSDIDLKKIDVLDDLEDNTEGKHFNYWRLAFIPFTAVVASCVIYFIRRMVKGV